MISFASSCHKRSLSFMQRWPQVARLSWDLKKLHSPTFLFQKETAWVTRSPSPSREPASLTFFSASWSRLLITFQKHRSRKLKSRKNTPEANMLPLKMDGWKTILSFWGFQPNFQGRDVSCRAGKIKQTSFLLKSLSSLSQNPQASWFLQLILIPKSHSLSEIFTLFIVNSSPQLGVDWLNHCKLAFQA